MDDQISTGQQRDRSSCDAPSKEEIAEALDRIVASEPFAAATRLSELLTYIVEQHLEDPTRKIPAKTIAYDVYGREPEPGSNSENIVRVDAGRLRRRLKEYYLGPGKDDPLRILIEPGGYTPSFEAVPSQANNSKNTSASVEPSERKSTSRSAVVLVAVFVSGLVLGLGVSLPWENTPTAVATTPDRDPHSLSPKRKALMAKSPASIQAFRLSEQARDMIFPLFEREQLKLTLDMFRQAIRRDNTYFGGFAGAAHSLAAMAVFLPEGNEREALLNEARQMADAATSRAATEAWTQSALAWVEFVEGDLEAARRHSNLALELDPTDGHALDFHAIMMLAMGDFVASRAASDPDRTRAGTPGQLANRAFYAAASFHLGEYETAISSFLDATYSGQATSAPNLAYLAASHAALGEMAVAKKYAHELQNNWPQFSAQVALGRLYANPSQANEVHDLLVSAGWELTMKEQ